MKLSATNKIKLSPLKDRFDSYYDLVKIQAVKSHKIPRSNVYEENAKKLLEKPSGIVGTLNKFLYKHLGRFENEGNEMGGVPLFLFAIVYMVGNRYMNARNKDERREILTRDSMTGFTAFFLTYAIQRFFAKVMEKRTGIQANVKTTDKKPKLLDWFSRKHGAIYINSYKEIGENYMARTPEQLRMYDKYIPLNIGSKLLNRLPQQAQDALKYLKSDAVKFFDPQTNLHKLVNSNTEVKQQVDVVLKAIEQHIVPMAKMAKVVPDTISTLFAVVLLGLFIPRFNIIHTRSIYQKKEQSGKSDKNQQNQSVQKNENPTHQPPATKNYPKSTGLIIKKNDILLA